MEKKMEKMVHNNVQLLGNRIPKAKRVETILDMARVQHEKKRRVHDEEDDVNADQIALSRVAESSTTTVPSGSSASSESVNQRNPSQGGLTWAVPVLRPTSFAFNSFANLDPQQRFNGPRTLEQMKPAPTPALTTTPLEKASQAPSISSGNERLNNSSPGVDIAAEAKRRPVSPPQSQEVVIVESTPPKAPNSARTSASNEKSKALSAISSSFKSMCFSTEDPVTSIDVTPDGQCIIAAFSNGSVRLFDVNSTCTEERFGYLLGHLDEELNSQMSASVVRVKVTSDGCYCFVGCRGTTPKVLMAIHLDKFRHEKDNDEDNLTKYFHSDGKIRGFADVSANTSPAGAPRSYFIITGLGIAKYRLWKFQEIAGKDPTWTCLRELSSSSNTALIAAFSPLSDSSVCFAGIGSDTNLKIFRFSSQTTADSSSETSQEMVPNTKDIIYIKGSFAYGIANAGGFYRVCLSDTSHRDTFDLDASRKTSRTASFVEHIYATDDGIHVIAIGDGVVYYATTDGVAKTGMYLMHMISTAISATLVPKYGIPAAIYVPNHVPVQEPVMLLTTNAEEEKDGFLTMDPIKKLQRVLARGKPSSGLNCWVCGSHSTLHWGVKSTKTPVNLAIQDAPSKPVPKPIEKPKVVREPRPPPPQQSQQNHNSPANQMTKFEILDLKETVENLEKELAMAQKRVSQVKNEADRRLRAELQLRRSWKKQQREYEAQLDTANQTMETLRLQNATLHTKWKEAKAKLAHETVKNEQENGVRLQYDQLCNQVRDKISRVDDHQKILEQTTKTLLQVIQRNTQALKNDGAETVLEVAKTECVVCRDKAANTAVYPCGHLCFCEEDGEKYKNHLRHQNHCPVCQAEMISLLRIYAP
ncbi:hypothetical protein AC1031_017365 [Aphanomyces cochlioides]|nr:hypothetical protein AC1031_017365 [Aphanomyces cochlioides]